MRLDHCPRRVIDRSAEADADAADVLARDPRGGEQSRHGPLDLPADALPTGPDIDRAAPPPAQPAVVGADAELQLGAADLDAEVVFCHNSDANPDRLAAFLRNARPHAGRGTLSSPI